jgi:hypothetical protein
VCASSAVAVACSLAYRTHNTTCLLITTHVLLVLQVTRGEHGTVEDEKVTAHTTAHANNIAPVSSVINQGSRLRTEFEWKSDEPTATPAATF